MRGYNDDLVMSCAIACWVRETALTVNKKEVAYKKAMLNSIFTTSTSLSTKIKGMKGYKEQSNYKEGDRHKVLDASDSPFYRR